MRYSVDAVGRPTRHRSGRGGRSAWWLPGNNKPGALRTGVRPWSESFGDPRL